MALVVVLCRPSDLGSRFLIGGGVRARTLAVLREAAKVGYVTCKTAGVCACNPLAFVKYRRFEKVRSVAPDGREAVALYLEC